MSYKKMSHHLSPGSYNDVEVSPQLKRTCTGGISLNSERSLIEFLLQDILVQVLCGVNHEDLKELFHVSKTIREATMMTKELHFDIKTPKKKRFAFLNTFDLEDANGNYKRAAEEKSRLNQKELNDNFSQALFAFMDEEEPRKDNCHRRIK